MGGRPGFLLELAVVHAAQTPAISPIEDRPSSRTWLLVRRITVATYTYIQKTLCMKNRYLANHKYLLYYKLVHYVMWLSVKMSNNRPKFVSHYFVICVKGIGGK